MLLLVLVLLVVLAALLEQPLLRLLLGVEVLVELPRSCRLAGCVPPSQAAQQRHSQ